MRFYTIGCAALAALLMAPVCGLAADAVHMTTPAKNAALIPTVPAFKAAVMNFYVGKKGISEGVMIRQSYIKDGKIVIPPAGLVYDSRMANAGSMTASEMIILGKNYTNVNEESEMLIVKDVVMKKGDMINLLPDGSRALHFQKGGQHSHGSHTAETATFGILKCNGNYYGSTFTVNKLHVFKDISKNEWQGTGLATGRHSLDKNAPEALQYGTYLGSSVAIAGNSYIVAGKVTSNEVEVKEFGTPSITSLWISDSPVMGKAFAAGEIVKIGDATVKIEAVGKDSAKVSLTDKAGTTITREFTDLLNPNAGDYLPGTAIEREKYQMATADDKVYVQVAILDPKGVIVDGKIRLNLFSNVQKFTSPEPWPADPRYNVRTDTCSSCRLLGELFLENKEEIVLDAKNNVITGPEGYFKVVIDDFDGTTVKAWHFEDAAGNKSGNLAGFAKGKHIDLVANFVDNGALGKFGYRTANNAFVKSLNEGASAMKK